MKNIAYLVGSLDACGPVNVLINIVKNLDFNRIKPIVMPLSLGTERSRQKELENAGITVDMSLARQGGVSSFITSVYNAQNTIQRHRIDAVHSHGFRVDLATALGFSSCARISTIHCLLNEDYPLSFGPRKGSMMAKTHGIALKKMDAIAGVSNIVAKSLRADYRLQRAIGIHNGIDINQFTPATLKTREKSRSYLGLGPENTAWIYVGHLSNRKNVIELIRAWRSAFDKHTEQHLYIVGTGLLMDECIKAGKGNPRVHIEGPSDNVIDYYHAADYGVSASTAEGAPMSILETLACGIPLVLSNISAHREIVDRDTPVGLSYDLYNEESFVKSLYEILKLDKRKLSRNSRKLVCTHYSAKGMADKYMALYEKVCS